MKFKIHQQKSLDNIPSASGLVKAGPFFYVLGDDSPFLFRLDEDFKQVARISILPNELRERIPKPEKPDFEALEMISENEMLGFGSGSLSPQRDRMIRITIGERLEIRDFSLSDFYTTLRELEIMKGSELNIEAAAFHKDQLYLFNRRKNVIFSLDYSKFIAAVQNFGPFPEVKATAIELPKLNGIEAGFTGAAITASGMLIVTTAVEDTGNAYDDGEVLGSFIGISSASKNGMFVEFLWTPISSEVPLKVESVCVLEETSAKEFIVALVTDSDGAESLILTGVISL